LSATELMQLIASGVVLGALYGLIAVGYTLVYGILQLINFAHGEIFMLGAFGALFIYSWVPAVPHLSVWLALPLLLVCGVAVSVAAGLAAERFAYRPLRHAGRLAPLITAIGLSIVLQQLVFLFYPVKSGSGVSWGASQEQVFPTTWLSDSIHLGGAYQAEIDAVCELADFWRFNVHFARLIHQDQPLSVPGAWNRSDYRALEGFVYAITPFNFSSIAGNLPTAPALMGNTVVWKPAVTQQLAAQVTMDVLTAAGLPGGVINMVTGRGPAISEVVLADPRLAGVHFTGSTQTFQHLWHTVGTNIGGYRTYPRLVGETGGKDFVIAHPSADPDALRTALIRGAFEYQGQKCSAVSRAYLPRSLWRRLAPDLAAQTAELAVGDITDAAVFAGALIDERAYRRVSRAIDRAIATPSIDILVGGQCDAITGWFVHPARLLKGTGSGPANPWLTLYTETDTLSRT
jgi:Aldehyde dehydrogenase family/Branched-chain amino acid transport system / permease component